MKRTVPFGLSIVLICLLSACPGAQTPVMDVAGTWTGFAGDSESNARKVLITTEFEQAGTGMGGTWYFGPITGSVEGSTVTFSFSFLAGSDGAMATYEFTGTAAGNTYRGHGCRRSEQVGFRATRGFRPRAPVASSQVPPLAF